MRDAREVLIFLHYAVSLQVKKTNDHRRRQGLKSGAAQLKERGPGRRPDRGMRDEPQR